MSTKNDAAAAKDQVLAWVRSKNPQTMELKFGCKVQWDNIECIYIGTERDYCLLYNPQYGARNKRRFADMGFEIGSAFRAYKESIEILGSDMGLQELLIALQAEWDDCAYNHSASEQIERLAKFAVIGGRDQVWVFVLERFDLTQNLHNQKPEFYEAILPLIGS